MREEADAAPFAQKAAQREADRQHKAAERESRRAQWEQMKAGQ